MTRSRACVFRCQLVSPRSELAMRMQIGRGCSGETYRWTARGSSHEPGTDCTTMLDSCTPHSSSFALVPASSGSMILSFQRAWMMPTRRPRPSWCTGEGPLVCILCRVVVVGGDAG